MTQVNGGLISRSRIVRRVSGLRDYPIPSEVKVYSAATGELLRVEQPQDFETAEKTRKKSGRNYD